MVQVCAEKYYPYVECLYEAAAIHASDGDLVCAELDCAAALGAATSDAVAARPAALVAVTCAALVLYWAAVILKQLASCPALTAGSCSGSAKRWLTGYKGTLRAETKKQRSA